MFVDWVTYIAMWSKLGQLQMTTNKYPVAIKLMNMPTNRLKLVLSKEWEYVDEFISELLASGIDNISVIHIQE